MRATKRVREWLGSPEGSKEFISWMSNPVTMLLLEAARERARPSASEIYVPKGVDPSACMLGIGIGANDTLDFLESPFVAIQPVRRMPEARYEAPSASETKSVA